MALLNNDELLHSYRLKSLIRYNTRNKIKHESVAEHSFYVGLFTIEICDTYNVSDEIRLKALTKAILHDTPEIELNDITHDVKERLNLRPLLKQYEDDFYKKYYKNQSELMCNELTIVDAIVKLADVYSVKQYCLSELELGNNNSDVLEIYQNSINRIDKLERKLSDEILGNRD